MTRHRLLACSALLGLTLAALPEFAQPCAAEPAPQDMGQAPMPSQALGQTGDQGGGEPAIAAEPGQVPVFAVTSVEMVQSTQAPAVSLVVVRG